MVVDEAKRRLSVLSEKGYGQRHLMVRSFEDTDQPNAIDDILIKDDVAIIDVSFYPSAQLEKYFGEKCFQCGEPATCKGILNDPLCKNCARDVAGNPIGS